MAHRSNRKGKSEPSDAEVREILVHAMADVGADPALVYAFQKTGVYVCDENEQGLPKRSLQAFDGAVDECFRRRCTAGRHSVVIPFAPESRKLGARYGSWCTLSLNR